MARRRKTIDPTADLPRVMEILERELSLQREAMDRLKAMSVDPRANRAATPSSSARKTA
jgi:hypothetical protein